MGRTTKIARRCLDRFDQIRISTVLAWFSVIAILWTAMLILEAYPFYFPPNFETGFLRGRKAYFHGVYAIAFYSHIATTPLALILGLLQLNLRIRVRWPAIHRRIGKLYVGIVLICVAPSGLIMALRAPHGYGAISGFAVLSVVTWIATMLGWIRAAAGRLDSHRRWMWRSYLLICSAVLLRILAVLATDLQLTAATAYPIAAWASWLPSLVIFEVVMRFKRANIKSPSIR
ncbi:putative membrane protein [Rhodopirellula maiorica SM1]|uniref:Putative membrane protein n=1 Tax=Rhodopirellula maiorica SM1 TaxID=1265738 RepID=M5RFW6_9BACT|nr:DUF2306 domain-containing protein [Rhodopirellula maiorica]EMI18006.1 putative membrane protein [Rhodopirellula maiorica SM1]